MKFHKLNYCYNQLMVQCTSYGSFFYNHLLYDVRLCAVWFVVSVMWTVDSESDSAHDIHDEMISYCKYIYIYI